MTASSPAPSRACPPPSCYKYRLMPHRNPLARLLLALLVLIASCQWAGCQGGASPPQEIPRELPPFDAERAWSLLLEQVELGPRPSGSPENVKLRDWIAADLEASGLVPVREAFVAEHAPGGPIPMENVYADLEAPAGPEGQPAPMIIIGAHFDTKKLPFEFVGANDGASGVATLLELARVLKAGSAPQVSYRFLFLDGEEAVRRDWQDPDNRYGSRHHVSELTKTRGALKRTKAFVLLDLVGDKDLVLERDQTSTRKLLDLFIKTARELEQPDLFAKTPIPVKDDHESFLEFRIPSVDLIDLQFGKYGNEYWHTTEDTVDKCSKESLDIVGRLVLATLPKVEAAYCR
jgi:glutaminyl-peptide cyclotransferase